MKRLILNKIHREESLLAIIIIALVNLFKADAIIVKHNHQA